MTKNRRGYTLLELIIACSLVMIVLYGLYTSFSSMVNFQSEALRKSSVNSWTVASLGTMTKEIENATILYFPNSANTPTNNILGCSNWSNQAINPGTGLKGYTLDPSSPVTEFYYCLDTTSGPTDATGAHINLLRRIAVVGAACPTGAVAPGSMGCTNATSLGAGGTNDVIATEVNFIPGGSGSLFSYNTSASANGVNLTFVIGNPNPAGTAEASGTPSSARIVNPQTTTVNTTIALDRPYMDSND